MRGQSLDVERGVRLGLLKRSEEGRVYDAFRQRVIFPIRDPRGRVIGFGGRHLGGAEPERRNEPPPKYINSPESELFHKGSVLYGHFEGRDAIRTGRRLLLMEGYTDVMMAHQAGFGSAVATLGTALTEANVERIARFADRVALVFDGDRAGFEAAHKAALLFAPRPIETRVVLLAGGVDPCELLATPAGVETFRGLVENGVEALEFVLDRCLGAEDLESASGRDRAARAFFGYVERIASEIGRGTALERLAGRIAQPFERVERDFRAGRAHRPPAAADPAERELPREEEGILLAALAGATEAGVVFRLRPPEHFRDPLLARVAAWIAAGGGDLDPLGIEAAPEKAKALELVERRREIAHDGESAMRLLVELVRRHLRALAREGQELLARGADEGWIRRITEIRRAVAELGARPPLEPEALVEILDRFEVPSASNT
jgi:DNA primase